MAESPSSDAPLMLSVSGVRGIVGESMTPQVAASFAGAFGLFIKGSSRRETPVLCVGRDSRPSGPSLMDAVMQGLTASGCRVMDLGVVATPTVGVMIGAHEADGGMIVTASHNPTPWNGLKCLNADGVAPPPETAGEIIQRFHEAVDPDTPPTQFQGAGLIESDDSANDRHIEKVLACIDGGSIRQAGLKVVLDSINGAGCVSGRALLERLCCEVVHINGEPTGEFAHTPEPTAENLIDLAARTKAEGAAIGFAQDPDADRLAIVDEKGSYIGEEYTLVLAAKSFLDHTSGGGVVAANLSTSRMIDDLAARYEGVEVVRTAVGEANVVAALQDAGNRALIGGEGNGGVILPAVCWVRDSLSSMALILRLLADEGKPLSAIVAGLPRYVMIKKKYDLTGVGGCEAVDPMLEKVKTHYVGARINDADGVRIDVEDGWVHLRPSNTEPIVRLIAEGKDEAGAGRLIDEAAGAAKLRL